MTSYFVAGGTLPIDVSSYVQRQADLDLFDALQAGEYCYVLDTRQVGKSSLIVRVAHRLSEHGCRVAMLDLSVMCEARSTEQWYFTLLMALARDVDLEDEAEEYWLKYRTVDSIQRWMLAIQEILLPTLKSPLVVFIDEIESVRKMELATDGFFTSIRALHNLRATQPALKSLCFCLVGVATPADLIRDRRTTPFNIGRRIVLRDFTLSEMKTLAPGLYGDAAQQEAQIRRIAYWTNGHPYLTQRLCLTASVTT